MPPNDAGNLGALHHRDLVADLELGQIVKLRFVEALALHRDQADRQAGGVELQHHRRQRARRQALQIGQRQVGELRDIRIGVGSRLEEDLDDADAQQRARLHVVDAAGQREEALQRIGDVGLDVLGRHAGVERGDHDLRQIDGRKQIHRHARHAGDPDHRQRQADDDDEVRIANRKAWHRDLRLASWQASCDRPADTRPAR